MSTITARNKFVVVWLDVGRRASEFDGTIDQRLVTISYADKNGVLVPEIPAIWPFQQESENYELASYIALDEITMPVRKELR